MRASCQAPNFTASFSVIRIASASTSGERIVCERVVIRQRARGGRDAGRAQRREKALGRADAGRGRTRSPRIAQADGARPGLSRCQASPGVRSQREGVRPGRQRALVGTVDQRGVATARQRFAQRPGRQQEAVAAETVVEDHEFGVACETVVLQAVVADDHVDVDDAPRSSACAAATRSGQTHTGARCGARSAAVRRRPGRREQAGVTAVGCDDLRAIAARHDARLEAGARATLRPAR